MKSLVAALLLVAGCGSHETSPPGALGKMYDVRAQLPEDVRRKAPGDATAPVHEKVLDVHGAKTKVVWHTFDDGANKYILSYGWEVVTPAPSVTLEPKGELNPMNIGDANAVIQEEIVGIRWHDNAAAGTELGDVSVVIDATGFAKTP